MKGGENKGAENVKRELREESSSSVEVMEARQR